MGAIWDESVQSRTWNHRQQHILMRFGDWINIDWCEKCVFENFWPNLKGVNLIASIQFLHLVEIFQCI